MLGKQCGAGMGHRNELVTITVKQLLDPVLKKSLLSFNVCIDVSATVKTVSFQEIAHFSRRPFPHFCFLMDLSLMWTPVTERSTTLAISLGLKLGSGTSSYLFRVKAVDTFISLRAKFLPMQFLGKENEGWGKI